MQGPLRGGLCQPPGLRLQRCPEPPPGPLWLHQQRSLLPGPHREGEALRGQESPRREESQTASSRPFSPLQRGDSFVTEDCSERCTCARSGVLLCEPLSCRAGEICTLANLTRGCFRGEPRPLWCCPPNVGGGGGGCRVLCPRPLPSCQEVGPLNPALSSFLRRVRGSEQLLPVRHRAGPFPGISSLCPPLSLAAGIFLEPSITPFIRTESPCLQNPCQNDGRCWEQGTHFTCECELGYGGHLCTEPWDGPAPGKPGENFIPSSQVAEERDSKAGL